LTRSAGEQNSFGVFARLPDDHVLAFLMATHPRLGRKQQAKCIAPKDAVKATCPFLLVYRHDEAMLQMIVHMARTNVLPKAFDRLPGVRRLLGDPCA
jgi:hypothetical protein